MDNILQTDENGNSTLMWAVARNDIKAVMQILFRCRGSDVTRILLHANFMGETALHIAARGGMEHICTLLVRLGANPNMATAEGLTSLHLAALNGHRLCVKVLVLFGAQINTADLEGDRPIHWAVRGSQPVILSTLIDLGCDLTARNIDGESALDLAIQNRDQKCTQVLFDSGAKSAPFLPSGSLHSSQSFPLLVAPESLTPFAKPKMGDNNNVDPKRQNALLGCCESLETQSFICDPDIISPLS